MEKLIYKSANYGMPKGESLLLSPAYTTIYPGDIGCIALTNMSDENLPQQVQSDLNYLVYQRRCRGLVLDLRDVDEGTFANAINLMQLFLFNQFLVTVEMEVDRVGRTDHVSQYFELYRDILQVTTTNTDTNKTETQQFRRYANTSETVPLRVLVNGNTKSSAVLLAAALRDRARCLKMYGAETYPNADTKVYVQDQSGVIYEGKNRRIYGTSNEPLGNQTGDLQNGYMPDVEIADANDPKVAKGDESKDATLRAALEDLRNS